MTKKCTIVTYHYVRDMARSKYPKIKGLSISLFIKQLNWLSKNYEFVTMQNCIDAVYSNAAFPDKAVLLTFDDGYMDHFTAVFPILKERGIQGCFFPSAKAVWKREVLDVNKIHFILASTKKPGDLLNIIYAYLDEYRMKYNLQSNRYCFSKSAKEDTFDSEEVVLIKRLLQRELDEQVRKSIINRLFSKYVTTDEPNFSAELYMNAEQLKYMVNEGMYVGAHGYKHCWLNRLPPDQQNKEVDLSLDFLKTIGAPTDNWAMCYPYGAYDKSLIRILKNRGCKLGLTIRLGIAGFTKDNALTLERFDTNDLTGLPRLSF